MEEALPLSEALTSWAASISSDSR